mmetsp:Transcript_8855/g.11690  ORF Transcript_8855/g.11690 Transcript_8855/m.11690 type:complete len:331 (+) Transcript_8855:166-1158(+)|eukprot:CAMPEP_0117752540 /NCGR_PEP_ID=MMETSP0947-20121206/11666_1 /TAXON_ID=44440 /ORGANISM="Chattonella subsalsa, Strain CCMP2191" /LENGTH=330 /DNA_ID=CAMNT_0005571201 /DNA_START=215 /DNA_END=1207 /DNA_ORIENTATION=-
MQSLSQGVQQIKNATVNKGKVLETYKDVIEAIDKYEEEETKKNEPAGCYRFGYWFQNCFGFGEGCLKLCWHSGMAMCTAPFFLCCYHPDRDMKGNNCMIPMFLHHKNMVLILQEGVFEYIPQNVCCPCCPEYIGELHVPIERPPNPDPDAGDMVGSAICCLCNLCIKCCCTHGMCDLELEDIEWVTKRALRLELCAFSGCSPNPGLCCGPCCDCCEGNYETLPQQVERWKAERDDEIKAATIRFYQTTYGCNSYEEHCNKVYGGGLFGPKKDEVQPVNQAEVMDGRNTPGNVVVPTNDDADQTATIQIQLPASASALQNQAGKLFKAAIK